jgi:hypothetical protein
MTFSRSHQNWRSDSRVATCVLTIFFGFEELQISKRIQNPALHLTVGLVKKLSVTGQLPAQYGICLPRATSLTASALFEYATNPCTL